MSLRAPAESGKPEKSPNMGSHSHARGLLMATLLTVAGGAISNKALAQENPLPECAADPVCNRLQADVYNPTVLIPEKEQDLMVKAQESLSRLYINPSVGPFLSMIGKKEEVNNALKAAISNPFELSYREAPGERIIIERRPSAKPESKIPEDLRIIIEHGRVVQVGKLKIEDDGWEGADQIENRLGELTKKIKLKTISRSEKKEFKNLFLGFAKRLNELRALRQDSITADCAAAVPTIPSGTLRIPKGGGMIRFTTRTGELVADISREGFALEWVGEQKTGHFELKRACVDTYRRRYQEKLNQAQTARGR